MKNAYILSKIAEQDIEEIIDFIAQDNIKATYDFIDVLYDTFDKLSENPFMGHVRKDLTVHPVRFWTLKWHYLIVYAPLQPLQIVRVLSGFRDVAKLI